MGKLSAVRVAGSIATAVVLATMVLAACTATPVGPPPSPTPTSEAASPTPDPVVDPVDPLDTVVMLVARPEALELRDESGAVVVELDYLGDAASAITTIGRVMGGPPVAEEYQGSNHFPPSTAHRWGAFELWEQRYVDRWEFMAEDERDLYRPSFKVVLTGSESAGAALTTEQGIVAGSAWADLEALPDLQINPSGCSGPYLDFTVYEETWPDGTAHDRRYAVDYVASEDGASIARVRAPMPIQDGCA
jgi:hypothetical protein